MSRAERITIAAVLLLAVVFAAVLATGLADSLNALSWFGSGANVIQWTSGIGVALAIATAVTMHLTRTCAASWRCFRRGEHPVAGTLEKVCDHHHTLQHHEAVHSKHAAAHAASGRLDRGESHARVRPPVSRAPRTRR